MTNTIWGSSKIATGDENLSPFLQNSILHIHQVIESAKGCYDWLKKNKDREDVQLQGGIQNYAQKARISCKD